MGLAELFNRDVQYVATDMKTGQSATFTITDNLAPDWSYGAYMGGMALPGAWRAAHLLSDLLGAVPWDAYRKRAGGPPEKLDPMPSLLEQPAPPDVRVTTFSSWALDLIWDGNAIGIIAERDRTGWPTAVVPIPARYVRIRRSIMGDPYGLPVGHVLYQVGESVYSHQDVIHIKGPCIPGWLRGFGVLENHLNGTLSLAKEQARQAASLGTSGIPTGLLKVDDPDFEEPDAAKLKASWLQSQRDRTVAVLNSTTDFQPLSWNPSETQLLEARKFSLHETALIFGLDPSWLGVSGHGMTYKNIESEAINLIKFSLGGHLARFEQTLSAHMPRGTFAEANLDSILRADTLTRYQAHAIGIDKGFLTDDEVRDMERRPPLTPAQRADRLPPPVAPPSAGQAPTTPATQEPQP